MITDQEITAAGSFTKTHGLKGELHALLDIDADFFQPGSCFIIDVDGIYVPFFVESVRPKGHFATLIKPDGVNSEPEAKLFVGKTIYVNKKALMDFDRLNADPEAEGSYADDFIGYTILNDEGNPLGVITDLETSTANTLFIVLSPQGDTIYVPVAEEFLLAIDPDNKTITMNLPEGLIDLN